MLIRVFPRRTSMTPDDELAFVGEPGLFKPTDQPVAISVAFTWDIPEAHRLKRSWERFYSDVQTGGPAFGDPGGEFTLGMFVKTGMLITSRGCIRSCDFCLVPKREGPIRELEIKSGWNILDNNLFACSRQHVNKVFRMLYDQGKRVTFSGGLDARLFEPWHARLLNLIKIDQMFFACDSLKAIKPLGRVAEMIANFSQNQKRCYVLIGKDGETLQQAETRLKAVWDLGFLPFAMLYRPQDCKKRYDPAWSALQKTWSRPAATKAHMRGL